MPLACRALAACTLQGPAVPRHKPFCFLGQDSLEARGCSRTHGIALCQAGLADRKGSMLVLAGAAHFVTRRNNLTCLPALCRVVAGVLPRQRHQRDQDHARDRDKAERQRLHQAPAGGRPGRHHAGAATDLGRFGRRDCAGATAPPSGFQELVTRGCHALRPAARSALQCWWPTWRTACQCSR